MSNRHRHRVQSRVVAVFLQYVSALAFGLAPVEPNQPHLSWRFEPINTMVVVRQCLLAACVRVERSPDRRRRVECDDPLATSRTGIEFPSDSDIRLRNLSALGESTSSCKAQKFELSISRYGQRIATCKSRLSLSIVRSWGQRLWRVLNNGSSQLSVSCTKRTLAFHPALVLPNLARTSMFCAP